MNRFPLLISLVFAVPVSCQACATMAPDPNAPIRITDESALIVWDAKSHTEHFVRRADFQTKAKTFGFLVPTPSKPQLGAASDELFNNLERELLPKTKKVVQRGINLTPFAFALFTGERKTDSLAISASASNAAASSGFNEARSVQVVQQSRVGGYNASVLRASDTGSLLKWLRSHHYAVSSDSREWLSPYIKKGYFITAFQIASDVSSGYAQAQAVRLTFQSDRPFYPYREPKHAQKVAGDRILRVFYVGNGRVEGHIENGGTQGQWYSSMDYSGPLDVQKLSEQGIRVPDGTLRLTAFMDGASPRPGWGDLQFYPADNQGQVVPPPHLVYEDKRWWVPLDILALGVVLIIPLGRRLGKRNSI